MKRASLDDLTARAYDVLVIGGGIYGAMAAREAVLRGYRTALVERDDFGSGTSHNSLKIIHGGIRYVQHLDFARLRASAREQAFWHSAAPDLIRPLEFLIPLTGWGAKGPGAFAAAALLHGAAARGAGARAFAGAGVFTPKTARRRMNGLAPAGITGAGHWRDGQIDDANRLLLATLEAAASGGGALANYMNVETLLRDGQNITGARAHDEIGGATGEVTARIVLCCTGAGTGDLVATGLPEQGAQIFPTFARATNLVLNCRFSDAGLGLVSRSRSDAVIDRGGRMYFLTPWRGLTIAGTHESPARPGENPRDRAQMARDAAAFLAELNHACPALDLRQEDILHIHSGLIPADIDDARANVARSTRDSLVDHAVHHGVGGLISVIGVKYTTARLVCARALDRAETQLGPKRRAGDASLDTALPQVADSDCRIDDAASLALRLRTAVDVEMARSLSDLVLRRSLLAETGAFAGAGGLPRLRSLARQMGEYCGWDATRLAREVAACAEELGLTAE
ncbi:FAD-dependent oxidoreductase [Sulfitobacter aestuarii]|uniref:FAD-dependent oxidoreductase n=1 Tax=Sulfitobacter aestuarii TaxID=2161676 RepID=A0ABW5U3Y8_9RHOB